MKYMGSKRRIAKQLLPIILEHRKEGQYYVEPFCGGCNMIDKVTGPRIASDSNMFIVKMWQAFQNGWLPPEYISEEDYKLMQEWPVLYQPELIGFTGVACSFGSKWFGGYARNNRGTNYAKEGRANLIEQIKLLNDVVFIPETYLNLNIPPHSIVYCDPPYEGTVQYKDKNFDHSIFWQWCRHQCTKGNLMFISEYNAPGDFICVKEIIVHTNMEAAKKTQSNEKLFIHESQLDIYWSNYI